MKHGFIVLLLTGLSSATFAGRTPASPVDEHIAAPANSSRRHIQRHPLRLPGSHDHYRLNQEEMDPRHLQRDAPWRSTPAARVGYSFLCVFGVATLLYAGFRSFHPVLIHSEHVDLALGFIGLVASCIWYGVVQEAIMTTAYAGGMFPSATYLTCTNQFSMVLFSCLVMLFTRRPLNTDGSMRVAIPALSGCISSWAQDCALLYVTFPIQAMFKSSRIVPQMVLSSWLNSEDHGWRDYAAAITVSTCVGAFTLAMHGDTSAPESDYYWCGVLLMVCFLFFDSLTGSCQKRIYNRHPGFNPMDMMMASGVYQTLYIGLVIVGSVGFAPLVAFLKVSPVAIRDLLESGVSASLSQYLAYYIIKLRGPVALAIMLAVRQVLSILVSSVLYDHPISPLSWAFAICALLVSCGRTVFDQASKAPKDKMSQKTYGAIKGNNV